VRDKLLSHSEIGWPLPVSLAQIGATLGSQPAVDELLRATFRSAPVGTSTLARRAVRISAPENRILLNGSC
jgi:hypothetical protein